MKGTVLWFNTEKGYGFIKPEGGLKDFFVHVSGIAKEDGKDKLVKDQKVEFEVSENDKGPMAINVKVMKEQTKVVATQ
jgi:CspA family cold shock protein